MQIDLYIYNTKLVYFITKYYGENIKKNKMLIRV